jgi:hypothetical protein
MLTTLSHVEGQIQMAKIRMIQTSSKARPEICLRKFKEIER